MDDLASGASHVLLLEYWKPIPGWEGLYSITNTGRVYSHRNAIELKPHFNKGYTRYSLSRCDKLHHRFTHRLVAAAFIGPQKEEITVNHKNGVKNCNHLSNLEYMTNAENSRHAVINGLSNRGERNAHSKLTESAVRSIKENPAGLSNSQLALMFHIHRTSIQRVKSEKTWSFLAR